MEIKDGKATFSREELRLQKVNLIDRDSITAHRGKCPKCHATFEFTDARTKEIETSVGLVVSTHDENGIVIARCTRCDETFSVRVVNPDYCRFRNGAQLVDHAFDPIDEKLAALPCATAFVDVEHQVGQRDYAYEFALHPLYLCDACGCELDAVAFSDLSAQRSAIAQAYGNYVTWSLAQGRGPNPEYAIVRIASTCTCGRALTAFFYTTYREGAFPENKDLALANIIGSRPLSQRIPVALYTKDEVIAWLHKLLARWTLAFDEVYVITPFFGHTFQSNEQKVESWLDIVKRVDPRKTRIFTRSGQLKDFRKAFEEVMEQPYEKLVEHDLGSPIINETKQTNKFHAKVYGAVGKGHCEVFTGSANVVKGPSKEVMHFAQMDSDATFRAAFLEPLSIQPLTKADAKSRYAIVLDQRNGFDPVKSGGRVEEKEYWELVMNDHVG
jgi:uncharacterized C2H2 Zn-finger protein